MVSSFFSSSISNPNEFSRTPIRQKIKYRKTTIQNGIAKTFEDIFLTAFDTNGKATYIPMIIGIYHMCPIKYVLRNRTSLRSPM